ncbi:hypothetical protein [Microbacterium galbinum]|uniref:hypothetical protein n=1 Tax=Microbacterium galbinum TaxID=2851646 RepID=UPI001FFD8710|nr:hypothetical protein [Microbacterium galbinum]MCK2031261.1 hypothetical protein [Microbacterium galbinum]
MLEDRIETFTTHLHEDASIPKATRDLALSVLKLLPDAVDYLIDIGDPLHFMTTASMLGERVLDDLRRALAPGSDDDLLSWAKQASDEIASHFDAIEIELPPLERQQADLFVSRARGLSQQASVLQDQESLRSEAVKLNAELQDSAAKAKDAAGIVGASSLATHFGDYADREVKSANAFRTAALVGFGLALAFALLFGNGAHGLIVTFESEWVALAFKATGAIGIGGISAYLARQSGQHRRMANWARSMEVQLQSFPAFIEPLGYDQQAEMYGLLARRVLTAPPEKTGSASDDSVGAAQLIDVFTSLIKRSNSPAP